MAEAHTSQNVDDKTCAFLEIVKNEDIDPCNVKLNRVLNAMEKMSTKVSSNIDKTSKKIADDVSNKFMDTVSKRSPDIVRKCVILWIETYLKNTEMTDAGGKLDTFILTNG